MKRREFIKIASGAAMLPLLPSFAAHAQRSDKIYRVSYLALLPGEDMTLAKPLMQRLRELGYSEGKNLILEYRSADGHPERLAQLAAELVQTNTDVVVTGFGTLAAKAAAAATKSIPIVFSSIGDPVGAGLVASLGKPGGNVTGVSSQSGDVAAKRVQILEDILPGRQTIAVLLNPDTPFSVLALRQMKSATEQSGKRPLAVIEARTPDEVSAGIEAAIKAGKTGLLTLEDPLLRAEMRNIVERAATGRLPVIYGDRAFVEAGGLISYGVDRAQLSRRAAEYVDKILKGARPSDLPIEQPTKFELVLNLKAAKALGLAIPPSVLALADEVIE
jgi:putative ABC transport system substrate-binding protein